MSEILKLSRKEKLSLMEAIWASLATDPGSIPTPDTHREEIRRRLNEMDAHPDMPMHSLEEVKKRIESRLGK